MTGLGIKVYTDEDIDVDLASALLILGYDVLSTRDAGNAHQGHNDERQLQYAVAASRAIFTHNIADFMRLEREWKAQDREHCGIIISERVQVGELIRRLKKSPRLGQPGLTTQRAAVSQNLTACGLSAATTPSWKAWPSARRSSPG